MTACFCPSMPEMGSRDPIPTGPVVCVCCGHSLELTCAGKCGKVDESIAAAGQIIPKVSQDDSLAAVTPPLAAPAQAANGKATRASRTYAERNCQRCGQVFQRTGPNSKFCKRLTCAPKAVAP